ncbi:hypothetical protein AGMMS49546_21830 [Spirochaetia bacterium]|nr:hypothetical protein AGMMS49546_21830 [Spirochaetia bacterium]
MTAEQKTHLASFLDLTADTLRGGYTRERAPYAFSADPKFTPPAPQAGTEGEERPLVMLIGEGLEAGGAAGQLLDKMLASIGLFRGKNCRSGTSAEISGLNPRMILCLGPAPGFPGLSIPVLTTYHPEELLQNPSLKRPAWEDLKSLRAKLMELDRDYAQSVMDRP